MNDSTHEGATPLMKVMQSGTIDAVRILITAGAALYQICLSGLTALHNAAASGCVAGVQLLLDSGARLTVSNAEGYSR